MNSKLDSGKRGTSLKSTTRSLYFRTVAQQHHHGPNKNVSRLGWRIYLNLAHNDGSLYTGISFRRRARARVAYNIPNYRRYFYTV